MRITGGQFRNRRLKSLPGKNTRPTTDRTKEAIFNSLMHKVSNVEVFVDVFSGSGAMACEAISRGYQKAYAIEKSKEASKIIKSNIELLGIADQVVLYPMDYQLGLGKIREAVDVVFIDPPYGQIDLNQIFKSVLALPLKESTWIVLETDHNDDVAERYEDFICIDQKKYGKSLVSYFRKED